MSKYAINEYIKHGPTIQIIPLIDILLFALLIFMSLSISNQLESELGISVPQAKMSEESTRMPGEIIINVTKEGQYIVNQNEQTFEQLEEMLKKVGELFPNQPVIIRADQNTYHKYIVNVLDACARSNIWDISFSTAKAE